MVLYYAVSPSTIGLGLLLTGNYDTAPLAIVTRAEHTEKILNVRLSLTRPHPTTTRKELCVFGVSRGCNKSTHTHTPFRFLSYIYESKLRQPLMMYMGYYVEYVVLEYSVAQNYILGTV